MKSTIKNLIIIAIVLTVSVVLAGCIKEAAVKKEFVPQPIPTNASFADRLNSQMPDDENYMFSPLSVKMALALAANGAEGNTKQELISAIGAEDLDKFNRSMAKLIETYSKSEKLQIKAANAVFVNTDNSPYDFSDSYKNTVKKYYNAESQKVNNKNAVKTINDWVNDNTNGKIKKIIDDSDFWASLVNAIYFKGAWEDKFSKHATKPDTFTSYNGEKTEIDFMNRTDSMRYSKSDKAEIVVLPYMNSFSEMDENGEYTEEYLRDSNAAMYLIKCGEDDNVEEIIENAEFYYQRIKLSVPKFELEYENELSQMLSYLGIKDAFDKYKADFSGMMNLGKDDSLWIDKVLHKTYIKVDEEGTEAAAVTAIMMEGATAAKPEEPIEVKFDEPFYFVIRVNGETLFMGRYAYAK